MRPQILRCLSELFYDVCKLCTDKFFIISLAVKFLRGAITGTGLIVTQAIFWCCKRLLLQWAVCYSWANWSACWLHIINSNVFRNSLDVTRYGRCIFRSKQHSFAFLYLKTVTAVGPRCRKDRPIDTYGHSFTARLKAAGFVNTCVANRQESYAKFTRPTPKLSSFVTTVWIEFATVCRNYENSELLS